MGTERGMMARVLVLPEPSLPSRGQGRAALSEAHLEDVLMQTTDAIRCADLGVLVSQE